MLKKCFVPACKNTSRDNSNKLFILEPQKPQERRSAWFQSVNLKYMSKASRTYCCEDHFNLEEDVENWMAYKTIAEKIRLRPGVVPHKFISSPKRRDDDVESQMSPSAERRKSDVIEHLRTSSVVKRRLTSNEPTISTTEDIEMSLLPSSGDCVTEGFDLTELHVAKASVGVQTETMNEWSTSSSSYIDIASDPAFSASVSTENKSSDSTYHLPQTDVLLRKHLQILEPNSRFYLGLPPDTYFIVNHIVKHANVSYRNVLICLKKIRLGDVDVRLADDFGLSPSYISQIFARDCPRIANVMKELIIWQEAKHIEAHLPIPFRYRCRERQAILDCFTIEIEAPSDALKQAPTWSNRKKCNSLKYMVSASPDGVINFISPCYGGRTSDKLVIETSKFVDSMADNCEIIADGGFKFIAPILAVKKCTLVRPPSMIAGQTRTKSEVEECRRIAALRIHIERVICRLRKFAMLKRHASVDQQWLNLYDSIVVIAAGIVNLQGAPIK